MCIFSNEVEVGATRIFARRISDRQVLIYEMSFSSADDMAMILPLPVMRTSSNDSLQFINLEKYEVLFENMELLFPRVIPQGPEPPSKASPTKLKVVKVGAYEASFIPSISEFSRLDSRFRLPMETWDDLHQYADYGFAVFKLRSGAKQHAHPMAFTFPVHENRPLFFPTVHVHDGQFTKLAEFDHTLYCQTPSPKPFRLAQQERALPNRLTTRTFRWQTSERPAKMYVVSSLTQGLVDGDTPIHKTVVSGLFENKDIIIG